MIDAFTLFTVFSFILGTAVGSFLNVVIYRLPINLSVNEPRRSFCPHCKQQIPFYQNIPLLSWLLLRGKCANCKAPIAFRYFAVELLTGLIFLGIWLHCLSHQQLTLVLPLWILASLLIAATFIDFDHFIIPDEITIGGTLAGLVLSFLVPSMMETNSNLMGFIWSLIGAITGFGLLWGVVELGKLAFGRIKHEFESPTPFTWTRHDDDAELVVGDEKLLWSDIFSRESDQLIMEADEVVIDGEKPVEETPLRFRYDRLLASDSKTAVMLDTIATISGKVCKMVIPREAMGFGDVKFIACIGAFLGWKAVLFSVVAASCLGAVVGVALMLAGQRDRSGRIPFGPYLAAGALLWVFAGPAMIDAYLNFITLPEPPLE